jgi:hypothetical protein
VRHGSSGKRSVRWHNEGNAARYSRTRPPAEEPHVDNHPVARRSEACRLGERGVGGA